MRTDQAVKALLEFEKAEFLKYTVELTPHQAKIFVVRCNPHANAVNSDLFAVVRIANELIPPMQYLEGNPNNGKPHHTFQIGREYSRVIYVRVIKSYLKDQSFDYGKLAQQFRRVGNADEAGIAVEEDPSEFVFRWWWD